VAWFLAQAGRAQVAWLEVTLHDKQAVERNDQLVAYVLDETRKLPSTPTRRNLAPALTVLPSRR
jgi:hypothetical protein